MEIWKMNTRFDVWHRLRLLRAQAIRQSVNTAVPVLERLRTSGAALPNCAEDYLQLAQQATGLDDFGYRGLTEGLEQLLASAINDAGLNYIGRKSFHLDTLRLLGNLLWLTEERKQIPEIRDIEISAPVFIMGLPRTASTFLHSLLMQDPAHRAPRIWEVTYPCPQSALDRSGDDRRARMQRNLLWLDFLEPDFQSAYPATSESPQECSEILSNVFASLRFDTTYDIPSYLAWMDGRSHENAYAFHRRFLQHLHHHNGGGRWILKCPDHVFFYNDILRVYPDARLIVTHRDPSKVIPSVAALTMILQGLFSDHTEATRVANRVLDRWVLGSRRIIDIARGTHARQKNVLHVFYEELTADPLATLGRIYAFLGSPLSPEVRARVRNYLTHPGAGGYHSNRYARHFKTLLPAPLVRERFHEYLDYFGIIPAHQTRERKRSNRSF